MESEEQKSEAAGAEIVGPQIPAEADPGAEESGAEESGAEELGAEDKGIIKEAIEAAQESVEEAGTQVKEALKEALDSAQLTVEPATAEEVAVITEAIEAAPHGEELTGLAVVVMLALLCGMIMQRFRQPAIAGYIIAGVILGPSGFSLVEDREIISQLAELGVLMLLYLIGMELSLRGARQVWKTALALAAMQISVGLLAMFGLGALLDWSTPRIVVLGFVVALSSTAVAIKMLDEIGELRTRIGQMTVGVLIAQDLAVVPMMLVVGSFDEGGTIGLDAVVKVVLSIAFLGLLIVYLSGRQRIRLPFARIVGNSIDLTPLAGLAFCFGAAALSGVLGLSAAYGAFLAGLVIGNSTSRRIMIHYTAPIQSILLMVFFLSIGLLIDLGFIWTNLWVVMTIVAFITIFKTALNVGGLRLLGESWPRALLSGVLLAQIGEFSFVLAALGVAVGSVSADNYRLIVAITVLSLIFSPLWLEVARRLTRIGLMGVSSPREILRLTFGREATALVRSTKRAETQVAGLATLVRERLTEKRDEAPAEKPAEGTANKEPAGKRPFAALLESARRGLARIGLPRNGLPGATRRQKSPDAPEELESDPDLPAPGPRGA